MKHLFIAFHEGINTPAYSKTLSGDLTYALKEQVQTKFHNSITKRHTMYVELSLTHHTGKKKSMDILSINIKKKCSKSIAVWF